MRTADFDFHLPPESIAERPAEKRDSSRLLVLGRDGSREHRHFSDLPAYLNAGDILILNNSRVLPARIIATKPTGGKIEITLVSRLSDRSWTALTRERYSGILSAGDRFSIELVDGKTVNFSSSNEMTEIINTHGLMPLPPYIRRKPDRNDRERYQTVYAEVEGSIAAPTAGLHFTDELMNKLRERSVLVRMITLHVGTGTFRPVKAEMVIDHRMDEEKFEMDASLMSEMREASERGNRVITVGTTTTRTLEGYLAGKCSIYSSNGRIRGATDIFIHEGHRFRAADALLTNFHLPRSTPLMLAAAFAGRKNLLNAYNEAISMGYRFFSYGDAMLLL